VIGDGTRVGNSMRDRSPRARDPRLSIGRWRSVWFMLEAIFDWLASDRTRRELIRYLVVGAANTAIAYLLFAGFILAGMAYDGALLLALIIAVLVSFAATGRLVFDNRDWRRIGWFIAAYAVFYWINIGLLHLFTCHGLGPLAAQALCLPVMTPLSFIVNKFLVFGGRRSVAARNGSARG
jgi:putative flippase GtrA